MPEGCWPTLMLLAGLRKTMLFFLQKANSDRSETRKWDRRVPCRPPRMAWMSSWVTSRRWS
jgi:hypothetical protein